MSGDCYHSLIKFLACVFLGMIVGFTWRCEMFAVCCLFAKVCLCMVLIGCFFFLFAMLDNDEEEVAVAGFIGRILDYLILLKTRDKPYQRQAILKACTYFQLSLSIMHVSLLKFFKTKIYFCVVLLLLLLEYGNTVIMVV